MVIKYNKFMSVTDYYDDVMSYYLRWKKTLEWYEKLGIALLQTIFRNSFYLNNAHNEQKIFLFMYLDWVIENLLGIATCHPNFRSVKKMHLPYYGEKDSKSKTQVFCCQERNDFRGFCFGTMF